LCIGRGPSNGYVIFQCNDFSFIDIILIDDCVLGIICKIELHGLAEGHMDLINHHCGGTDELRSAIGESIAWSHKLMKIKKL
jgi:hypothetical protein